MIVTVDGEGGTGKTTTCEYFSKKLHYFHIDSGAMFRWLAYIINKEAYDPGIIPIVELNKIIQRSFKVEENTAIYQKQYDSIYLQSESIGILAHNLGKFERIENWFIEYQRFLAFKMLKKNFEGILVSGRIGGSKIFPNADKKFYFLADAQIRAKRRVDQLKQCGIKDIKFDAVLKSMLERDELNKTRIRDMNKDKNSNTIIIDTTNFTLDQLFTNFRKHLK
jgi:cytidylate kinase